MMASSSQTIYGLQRWGIQCCPPNVFAVTSDGTRFTTLYTFKFGANPTSFIFSENAFYGTTLSRSWGDDGDTLFSISFVPLLAMTRSETSIVLSWPTDYAGFDYTAYHLWSATTLGSSAVWTTISPSPLADNGKHTVTNLISPAQQFFQLRK
jgi:hypothetical protein